MKPNALELLSAMNEQQTRQMMAANLLAIAVCMKKSGLQEITISPGDIAKLIEPGESLLPSQNVDGGFTYRFVKAQPPLAKLPTPTTMTKPREKRTKKGKK